MPPLNATDVLFNNGSCNEGGITQEIFYAPIEDFTTIQAPPDLATATTFKQAGEIATAHVFATGKCFKKLYITSETGEVMFNQVGPRDSKSFENMVEGSYPSNDPEFIGFLHYANNKSFIVIAKERNGKLRQIGSKDFPAFVESVAGKSGKAMADGRSTIVQFKAGACYPAPVYAAAVQLTPAA